MVACLRQPLATPLQAIAGAALTVIVTAVIAMRAQDSLADNGITRVVANASVPAVESEPAIFSGPRRPLVLAWLNAWPGAENILIEPVVTALTKATGLRVVLRDPNAGAEGIHAASDAAADSVDVFLVASLGSKDPIRAAMSRHGHRALFIWFGSEAREDNFVDTAHVSFGQARNPVQQLYTLALASPNFKRMPLWMTHAVYSAAEPSAPGGLECRLDPRLSVPTGPDEWAARAGFAVHVAGHDAWPRPGLVSMFSSLALELDAQTVGPTKAAGRRRVDVLGGTPLRNSEWPEKVTNDGPRGQGKVNLARGYRFAIQPENAQTPCGGYTTEKLVHAHLAGAVPVYWGDELDPEVWDERRILRLEDGPRWAWVNATAWRLEADPAFRTDFFSVPILAPGAAAWVRDWCDDAAALLRRVIAAHPGLGARVRLAEEEAALAAVAG